MSEYTDRLDSGFVPADRVRGAIRQALGPFEWSRDEPKLQPLTRMWEIDDLEKMLVERDGKSVKWVRFDLADKVLCLLNLPHLWWGPLRSWYYRVVLDGTESQLDRPVPKGMKRCERDGCSTVFEKRGTGQSEKKFCCLTCLRTQQYRRINDARSLGERADECPHGHVRTEENTYVSKRGHKECRVCKRDRMRARRALAVAA